MSRTHPGTITAGLLLLAVAAAANLAAQTAPTLDLGKRDARSKYAFGRLVAVAELPDGRVVASDAKEEAFRLLDLSKGTDALIGRQGTDPDQYASAGVILSAPGDSLYLFDGRGRKFLRLAPDGHFAEPIAYAPPSTGGRHMGLPMAMDSNGRVYAVCFDIDTTTKPMHLKQSVCSITGGTAEEKVLSLDHREAAAPVQGLQIFPFRDAWAVRHDGTMALVQADSYDVVWSRDGHESGRTGPLPYQPIPLTPAEQRAATDSVHEMMTVSRAPIAMAPAGQGGGTNIASDGGGGGTVVFAHQGSGAATSTSSGGAGTMLQPTMMNPVDIPIAPFPPFKPPIPSSGTAAIFAPDGMLWVARERAHGDKIPVYDVIGEGKGVVAHVRLPADTRLVGFGKDGVYLAHRDGDEEWLERYAMPTVTR